MCEVLLASNMRAHPTNTRAACARIEKKFKDDEMLFGLEQEYTMMRPDGSPSASLPVADSPLLRAVLLRRWNWSCHRT